MIDPDPDRQTIIYEVIARNLREFGYPDVTPDTIRDVDEAIQAKTELPHGIIGMFAQSQLERAKGQP